MYEHSPKYILVEKGNTVRFQSADMKLCAEGIVEEVNVHSVVIKKTGEVSKLYSRIVVKSVVK